MGRAFFCQTRVTQAKRNSAVATASQPLTAPNKPPTAAQSFTSPRPMAFPPPKNSAATRSGVPSRKNPQRAACGVISQRSTRPKPQRRSRDTVALGTVLVFASHHAAQARGRRASSPLTVGLRIDPSGAEARRSGRPQCSRRPTGRGGRRPRPNIRPGSVGAAPNLSVWQKRPV